MPCFALLDLASPLPAQALYLLQEDTVGIGAATSACLYDSASNTTPTPTPTPTSNCTQAIASSASISKSQYLLAAAVLASAAPGKNNHRRSCPSCLPSFLPPCPFTFPLSLHLSYAITCPSHWSTSSPRHRGVQSFKFPPDLLQYPPAEGKNSKRRDPRASLTTLVILRLHRQPGPAEPAHKPDVPSAAQQDGSRVGCNLRPWGLG
jgi:hypothetical protein